MILFYLFLFSNILGILRILWNLLYLLLLLLFDLLIYQYEYEHPLLLYHTINVFDFLMIFSLMI